jgi:hypothetical protein
MELSMDFMMIIQNKEDGKADRAILERLAKKLELQSLADLRAETMAIKKLINERNGQQQESTKHIIELLNKFKEIAGIDEKNILGDVSIPKYLEKCPSLMIPNDFLCPISLEIMTDPVIIASGRVCFVLRHSCSLIAKQVHICLIVHIFQLTCRLTREEVSRSG